MSLPSELYATPPVTVTRAEIIDALATAIKAVANARSAACFAQALNNHSSARIHEMALDDRLQSVVKLYNNLKNPGCQIIPGE